MYLWADGTRFEAEFAADQAPGIGPLKAKPDDWYTEARQTDDPAAALQLLAIQLKIIPGHAPSLTLQEELAARSAQTGE